MTRPRLVGEQSRRMGGIQWDTRETETELRDPINGKKIYRKCVDFGSLPSTGNTDVAHLISNLNVAANAYLRFECYVTNGTNFHDAKLLTNLTACTITATNCNIAVGADLSAYDAFFLIEYTKTA